MGCSSKSAFHIIRHVSLDRVPSRPHKHENEFGQQQNPGQGKKTGNHDGVTIVSIQVKVLGEWSTQSYSDDNIWGKSVADKLVEQKMVQQKPCNEFKAEDSQSNTAGDLHIIQTPVVGQDNGEVQKGRDGDPCGEERHSVLDEYSAEPNILGSSILLKFCNVIVHTSERQDETYVQGNWCESYVQESPVQPLSVPEEQPGNNHNVVHNEHDIEEGRDYVSLVDVVVPDAATDGRQGVHEPHKVPEVDHAPDQSKRPASRGDTQWVGIGYGPSCIQEQTWKWSVYR